MLDRDVCCCCYVLLLVLMTEAELFHRMVPLLSFLRRLLHILHSLTLSLVFLVVCPDGVVVVVVVDVVVVVFVVVVVVVQYSGKYENFFH